MLKENSAPPSSRFRATSSPPNSWMMPVEMESPNPKPMPTSLVVKNGSNKRVMMSSGIPRPVSRTRTTASPPCILASISMRRSPSSGKASLALLIRLTKTCSSRTSLTNTVISLRGISIEKSTFSFFRRGSTMRILSETTACSDTALRSSELSRAKILSRKIMPPMRSLKAEIRDRFSRASSGRF